MSATGPAKRAPNENSNLYEEKEIKLYKRHKKYYEDVVDIYFMNRFKLFLISIFLCQDIQ